MYTSIYNINLSKSTSVDLKIQKKVLQKEYLEVV